MATEIVKGFVATTNVLPIQGGLALTEEALHAMVDALRSGKLPFLAEHDPLRPIEVKVLVAEVKKTEQGSLGVWVEAEVPEGALEGMKGFSFGAGVALVQIGPDDAPRVRLYADSGRYSESDIDEAAGRLAEHGVQVEAGFYLQFSVDPAVVVLLHIAYELLISIGAAAIWDALRGLVRSGEPTEVRLEIDKSDGEVVKAVVRTDQPEVAHHAISTLAPLVEDALRLTYSNEGWQSADNGPGSHEPTELED